MILGSYLSLSKIYSGYFKYRLPALAGIIVLFLLPSDGLGINICWFQEIFVLPCPACGLTRGMSSLLHYEFYKSITYHPLAILVLSYLFLSALSNKPDYLKSVIRKKSKILGLFFSFKFMAFLFIVFWIVKLYNIY